MWPHNYSYELTVQKELYPKWDLQIPPCTITELEPTGASVGDHSVGGIVGIVIAIVTLGVVAR